MQELIKMIHNVQKMNNCDCVEIFGNSITLAKLPKNFGSERIKLRETSCDNNIIYVFPARSQPMQYIIEK